jgi:hypothetical protein
MAELLAANTTRFPHDTIDGETLLIDSVTGHLLAMSGVAPLLWRRLLGGVTAESLIGEVGSRFGAEAARSCQAFLESLIAAEIVVAIESAPDAPQEIDWPASFAAPRLERFDDIANIIAMDPIHEVDETAGWPHRRGEVPGE